MASGDINFDLSQKVTEIDSKDLWTSFQSFCCFLTTMSGSQVSTGGSDAPSTISSLLGPSRNTLRDKDQCRIA